MFADSNIRRVNGDVKEIAKEMLEQWDGVGDCRNVTSEHNDQRGSSLTPKQTCTCKVLCSVGQPGALT